MSKASKLLEEINTTNLEALADWLDIKYKDDPTPQVQTDLRQWAENIRQVIAELGKPEPTSDAVKILCKRYGTSLAKIALDLEAENERLKKEKKFLMKLSHRSDEDLNKMLKDQFQEA